MATSGNHDIKVLVNHRLWHKCPTPDIRVLPKVWDGAAGSGYAAEWKCPECKQRWETYQYIGALHWQREGRPSWRWRRAEAKRIKALVEKRVRENDQQ